MINFQALEVGGALYMIVIIAIFFLWLRSSKKNEEVKK
jgi:hypothetical protein